MPDKLPQLKAREIIRALRKDGWVDRAQRGSHLQMVHPTKPGRITIPVHKGRDVSRGTLESIMDQAGLTENELKELL